MNHIVNLQPECIKRGVCLRCWPEDETGWLGDTGSQLRSLESDYTVGSQQRIEMIYFPKNLNLSVNVSSGQ